MLTDSLCSCRAGGCLLAQQVICGHSQQSTVFPSLPDLFGPHFQLEPWAVVSLLQQRQQGGLGAAKLGAGLCRPFCSNLGISTSLSGKMASMDRSWLPPM